jgi:RNA polymerase sigma factor (sigma-70 family)
MAETSSSLFLHQVRHLIGSVPEAAMTDSQLLERFLVAHDETAVEVLVRRHGPLVFGVSRRVLRNAHAAEDVFQATFLILMRKAASLVCCKRLGSWLYMVAYRLALRARSNNARRQRCEAQAARIRSATESHATTPGDLVVALEEELHKLPEKHRVPLVLCYLEGKTNEQAAAILGCPRGSMFARLAQARERLRACLARRGCAVPSAGIATILANATAEAAVPLPLLDNTVRAAVWFAGEQADGGVVSTQAVALARGACHAMFVNKLKIAAAVLVAAAMLGTGATLFLKAAPLVNPSAQAPEPPTPEAPEKRLPLGALARMGTTQLRHDDVVSVAIYTPDGKALLTAGRDKRVRMWDLATGKELRRFDWGVWEPDTEPEPFKGGIVPRHEQQFWDDMARSAPAALSADGKLVSASRGGLVCVWETATGKKLRHWQTEQKRLIQLVFSANGKALLTLAPGQATAVWEVATGKCIRRSEGKPAPGVLAPVGAIATENVLVSPGLKYLAFWKPGDSGRTLIHIRDLATDKELHPITASPGTLALTFSADDKTLVWEHPEAGIVFSDVATGKELRRLKSVGRNDSERAMDAALAIAFSADGKSLAVSWMSHTIELWDLTSGKQTLPVGKVTKAVFEQHSVNWLNLLVRPALAFSPDGKKLVCSQGGPTIRQFQVDTGAELPGPGTGHRAPVSTLALSADGKSLWTYSTGDRARSWDWATGKQTGQREVPAEATHAVFATDGRCAFAAAYDFILCSAEAKQIGKIATGDSALVSLALSPDGALVATRNFTHPEVHLWDATTLKERYTLGRAADGQPISGAVTETTGVLPPDLVFSPDGRCLAGAGPSRQWCLWETTTGTLLWEVPPQIGQAIERFAFSQNGRCLACVNADRTVTLYEAVSGAKRGRLAEPDPNHRRVYLTDGSRSAWDSVQMRRDAPVCLAFSPDGRYLATAQHTPEIHLWDVLAGREVGQLQGPEGGVVSLLFTPDGKHLFSGGTDTTVLTWDVTRLTQSKPAHAAKLEPQVLDRLWIDLAGQDAGKAFDALRKLSASPDQAVTLLKERLHAVAKPDAKRLAQLLADLESNRFELRRQAESELEGLGELAEPALRKALAGDPMLDLRKRLERLLGNLSAQVHLAGQMREVRAVEVLEMIGSSEARQVLRTLASGVAGARLTREAQSAVQRLIKQARSPY